MSAEYRFFKRSSGKKKIYYARILDPAGNVVKTVSTGETNQYRAHEWIERQNQKSRSIVEETARERRVFIKAAMFERINDTFQGSVFLFETGAGRRYLRSYISNQLGKIDPRRSGPPDL